MKVAWLDLETSGFLRPETDIVEVALVLWDSETGQITDERSVICRPRQPMSDRVIEVHGITNERAFREGIEWERVAARLIHYLKQADAYGGQNIVRFDLKLLKMNLERVGLELPERPAIDILNLARTLIPKHRLHKKDLASLASYLGVEDDGAHHRALDDTKRSIMLFEKMLERWEGLTVEGLIAGSIDVAGDRDNLDLFRAGLDGHPKFRG